jgi:hypothetical protein
MANKLVGNKFQILKNKENLQIFKTFHLKIQIMMKIFNFILKIKNDFYY